jgi:CIC family chloride channel protein
MTLSQLEQRIQRLNEWRKKHISNRNFLILAAAVVGLLGGIAASLLKALTHLIEESLQHKLHWQYKYYLYLVFPALGIFLSVTYVKHFIRKRKFEHGLTPVLYSISRRSSKLDFHNIYSQIISSALTVGFGGSSGLEAPIVLSGSSIGSNIGRFFGLSYRDTTMLLACGAAAGIAGAFNSPVAGLVFAIEILLPEFSIPAFIPLLISAALGSVVAHVLYSKPLFKLVTQGWEVNALIPYVILALLLGLFSIYFTQLTFWVSARFKRITKRYHRVLTGGVLLGLLIAVFPALYGEGYVTIQNLLNGQYQSMLDNSFFAAHADSAPLLIVFTLLTLFGKSLAALITINAGGNGGTFGPSLVMGGLLGFVFAFTLNYTGLAHVNITNFIVAGMAGALSGIMHAPLTGIFLIAEITGGYMLMVPLMIVSAIAYFISKARNKHSIYTKGLAESGDLLSHEDKDRTVLHMMKLRYLVDRDFTVLHPHETLAARAADILASKRNIFPVVDKDGMLTGIAYGADLLPVLVDKDKAAQQRSLASFATPPEDTVSINRDMYEVMQRMDSLDVWILPVTDEDGRYQGFVTKTGVFNKYRALLVRQAGH